MSRKALYEEGLARGRYVRLPTSVDDLVTKMARDEERELGAILRRLIKAGLFNEGRLNQPPARAPAPSRKQAAA